MSKSNSHNMTSGNITAQLVLFTLPIIAGNALQQLYSTVDGIIVGQFIGQDALAAIGTCAPLTILYLALAVGLSTGSGIMVSQYYGGNRSDDLKVAASTSFVLLTAIGLLFSVFGSLIAGPLLQYLLAVPSAQLPDATSYFRFYCYGLVFSFVYNIVASILRALGDSKATLYFLLVSSVLNMILDYILIVPLEMGIPGAAIATVISQAVSAIVSVLYLLLRYPQLLPSSDLPIFDSEKCKTALQLGLPTTIQQGIISGGHIAVQRLVNSFGVATMSAFTAGSRLESYLLIPAIGFSVGMATFTGQNVGAGNYDRVKEGLHKTLLMSVSACACLAVIAFAFARPLVGLFGVSGESLELGIRYIRLVVPFFIIFGAYQAFVGLLQGAGDAGFTAFCTMSSLLLRVILSYLFVALFGITLESIPYAMPWGFCYVLTICILRYRKGSWKEKKVR